MSSRTYLSIGDVLSLLREEFPDVTISKIRFLESQGLVNPERSPSGYRKFYERDVERLRWVLRQQREHFLPLKIIRDRLEEGGTELETVAASPNGSAAEPASVGAAERGVGVRERVPAAVEHAPADRAVAQLASQSGARLTPSGPPPGPAREASTSAPPAAGSAPAPAPVAATPPPSPPPPPTPPPPPPPSPSPPATPAPSASPATPAAATSPRPPQQQPPPPAPRAPAAPAREGLPGIGTTAPTVVTASPTTTAPSATHAPQAPPPSEASTAPRTAPPSGPSSEPAAPLHAGAGRLTDAARQAPVPAAAASGGQGLDTAGLTGTSMTMEELSAATGLSSTTIASLEGFGLISPTAVAGVLYYDEEAFTVARTVADFARFGIEPRHLRPYRNAVDREMGLIEQVVTPLLRQRNPESRQRAVDAAAELAKLGQSLRASLLRRELRRQLGG